MNDPTWKPVVGYEGLYEVSDTGLVRSLPRVVMRANGVSLSVKARIMRLTKDGQGYLNVGTSRDGVTITEKVHRLVLRAFVGPRPEGLQARHLDDVKTNNHLSNLVWGTSRENKLDAVVNGRNANSNKTHCPSGHPYDESNTMWTGQDRRNRKCRACHYARKRQPRVT